MPNVRVGNVNLYYETLGKGKPLLMTIKFLLDFLQ